MDQVTILLFIGIIFFTGVLIAVDKIFASEGQVFQVMSSLLAGFAGAFFARITPHNGTKAPIVNATTIIPNLSDPQGKV